MMRIITAVSIIAIIASLVPVITTNPVEAAADPVFVANVDEALEKLGVLAAFDRLDREVDEDSLRASNALRDLGRRLDRVAARAETDGGRTDGGTRRQGAFTMYAIGKAADDWLEAEVLASVGGDSCSQVWIDFQRKKATDAYRRKAANRFVAALVKAAQAAVSGSGTPGPTGATGLTREEVIAIVRETVRQELAGVGLDSLKAEVSQLKTDLGNVAATLAYLGERRLVLGVEKKGKDKLGAVTTGTLLDEETRRALRAIKPPSSSP